MDNYPGFDIGHMPLKAEFENLRPLGIDPGSCLQKMLPPEPDEFRFGIFAVRDGSTVAGRRLQVPVKKPPQEITSSLATAGEVVEFQGRFYAHSVQHFLALTHASASSRSSPTLDSGSNDEWEATGMSDFDDDGDQHSDDQELTEATSRGSQTPDSMRSSTGHEFETPGSSCLADETESETSLNNIVEEFQHLVDSDLEGLAQVDGQSQRDLESLDSPAPPLPPTEFINLGHPTLISDGFDSAFFHIDMDLATELGVTETTLRQEAVPLGDLDAHIECSPRDTTIETTTPDGGNITGVLSGSPSFMPLPNRLEFQEVYVAMMGAPLTVGDCGTWIRDTATGKSLVTSSPEAQPQVSRLLCPPTRALLTQRVRWGKPTSPELYTGLV